MYEIGEESGELEFCHNPFSMPNGGLETLLKAERGEIVGGIAKFVQPCKEQIVSALGLSPNCFVGLSAGKKAAAQKKKDRIKAKLETQMISTGGQLLRKGLFGILFRK